MSDHELDLGKHVLIQRHDNSLFAIPLERLEEFRLDDKTAALIRNQTTKDDLKSQQSAFTGDLVAGPGCYRG